MSIILLLGLVFILAAVMGRVTTKLRLSSVTGYLLSGVLIGVIFPSVRTLVTADAMKIFSTFVISIITFMVGGELEVARLKKLPKGTLKLIVIQALITFTLVAAVVLLMGHKVGFALCLGAIGAASAPTTTIMIVKQRNAKGKFVDTLLPLVALDDAISVVLATVALAFAMSTENLGTMFGAIGLSLWEILGGIAVGAISGIILGFIIKFVKGGDELLYLVLGIIFLGTGLASMLSSSTIIAGLVSGATVANILVGHRKLFASLERFIPPFYVIIFTMAGMFFNPTIFLTIIPLFLAYLLSRTAGKILGTKAGIKVNGKDPKIGNYLGLAILSQSGLAVALAIAVYGMIPAYGEYMLAVVVPAVIIFEFISPILIDFALNKTQNMEQPVFYRIFFMKLKGYF